MTNNKKLIMHKIISKKQRSVYLCNQATNTTPEKSSYTWKNVTCKNCLKQKPVLCSVCKRKAKYDKERSQYYCEICQWWMCV